MEVHILRLGVILAGTIAMVVCGNGVEGVLEMLTERICLMESFLERHGVDTSEVRSIVRISSEARLSVMWRVQLATAIAFALGVLVGGIR